MAGAISVSRAGRLPFPSFPLPNPVEPPASGRTELPSGHPRAHHHQKSPLPRSSTSSSPITPPPQPITTSTNQNPRSSISGEEGTHHREHHHANPSPTPSSPCLQPLPRHPHGRADGERPQRRRQSFSAPHESRNPQILREEAPSAYVEVDSGLSDGFDSGQPPPLALASSSPSISISPSPNPPCDRHHLRLREIPNPPASLLSARPPSPPLCFSLREKN